MLPLPIITELPRVVDKLRQLKSMLCLEERTGGRTDYAPHNELDQRAPAIILSCLITVPVNLECAQPGVLENLITSR